MLFPIGLVIVFGSVITGYLMHHGKLAVLWQPNEIVIICGAALGAFIIANPLDLIKDVGKAFKKLFKGQPYKKAHYLELLAFLFTVFKLIKTKGMLEVEAHIENPHESELFRKFPKILNDHHIVDFFCDSLRLLTMGVDNPYSMDEILEKEIETHHHELEQTAAAITTVADAMPALGIVAAVLGVITTMGSITEPPAILGGLIAAALVGTFLGVLLAYGLIAPIGAFLTKFAHAETRYFECIKQGIIAHMQGNAPAITIEFVRKMIPPHTQPSFKETEAMINEVQEG